MLFMGTHVVEDYMEGNEKHQIPGRISSGKKS